LRYVFVQRTVGKRKLSSFKSLLPTTIMNKLRHRISAAVEAVTQDMSVEVWDEFK